MRRLVRLPQAAAAGLQQAAALAAAALVGIPWEARAALSTQGAALSL
jgi:hypothetical protein